MRIKELVYCKLSVMTIAEGEIDDNDRCQKSARGPSSLTARSVFYYYPRLYHASLSKHPSSMPLRRLLPLLSCPLCAVTRGNYPLPLLRNPFTLHCGHTVCSSHLETLDPTQRCPLPVCTSAPNQTPTRPNIPSSSRVIYLPPAPPPPSAQQAIATVIDQLGQRVDITVSKLIDVVSRHSPVRSLLSDSDHGGFDLSPGDEQHHQCEQPPPESALPSSDEEPGSRVARGAHRSSGRRRRRAPEPIPHSTASHHSQLTLPSTRSSSVADSVQNPLPSSSGLSDRSSSLPSRPTAGETSDGSDLSPEPPKKRLRRDARTSVTDREASSCATQPEAETNTSDSPSRPVTNRPQLNLLGTEPRRDPGGTGDDSQISGAKELLTELSCEICFAIYYQPVTTPCQHVSRQTLFPQHFGHLSLPFRLLSPGIYFGFLWYGADPTCVFFSPHPDISLGCFIISRISGVI